MAVNRKAEPSFDRLPPQNLEAERSVLGAMLLSNEAVGAAVEVLQDDPSDVFYSEAHQYIFSAILSLYRENTPIDAVTLLEQLTRDGKSEASGGAAYLSGLTTAVPTAANAEYYAKIVLDSSVLRRIISSCTSIAGEAYSLPGDVNALLDRAESEIFSIAEKRQTNPIYRVSDLLVEGIKRIESQMKSGGITGVPTGFTKLDELTSGFQPSDMIILAARPSVGKTAFALNLAAHAAVHEDKKVLVFSLEMAREQLVQRLLCMEGRVDSQRLRTGFLAQAEFPKLTKAADVLSRAPIFIDDTPNIGVLELRSKARRHAAQYGCDLLVVDYLQLMSGSKRAESRQVEISEISRSVKGLARELQVPVIALSQLSREADKDDTGAPKLSHLRESGAIEQDADVVLMISRPPAHELEENRNLINLSLAKQRNGPTGEIKLLFDRNIQRFKNLVEEPYGGGGGQGGGGGGGAYAETAAVEEVYDEDDVPF